MPLGPRQNAVRALLGGGCYHASTPPRHKRLARRLSLQTVPHIHPILVARADHAGLGLPRLSEQRFQTVLVVSVTGGSGA